MIRDAVPEDIPTVFCLVKELADYERLSHMVTGTAEDLRRHVFETGACRLVVCEIDGLVVGYGLYFLNFSTFLMKPGLYLEDIYVSPTARGKGYGKQILTHLVETARGLGCGRIEWAVLDWNQPAIDFYRRMGADILDDWRVCRIVL